jgi:alanyl-tRNA synthetase
MVRWDDLPPQCQKRPELPDIADTIQGEEEKAFALLDKATREVPKIVAKRGMSGETLAVLHHTHGYDPETVDGVVSVPPQIMADYYTAMETERDRSRAAIVREVVTVRTTGGSSTNANAKDQTP